MNQYPKPVNRAKRKRLARRGAVIPLVAVFLVVFIAMAAFSIDVAYMQLVRTQLQAASDSAAKAGTSALAQGKTDAET